MNSYHFKEIYDKGKKKVGRYMVLYVFLDQPSGEVGFVASKRIGNAVCRNRARRRLKACFHAMSLKTTACCVVVARRSCLKAKFAQIVLEMGKLLDSAGAIND